MRKHLEYLPGGQSFIESGLIELHDYKSVIERFTKIPRAAHQKIMLLFDEAQYLEDVHKQIMFQSVTFLALGERLRKG